MNPMQSLLAGVMAPRSSERSADRTLLWVSRQQPRLKQYSIAEYGILQATGSPLAANAAGWARAKSDEDSVYLEIPLGAPGTGRLQ